MEKYYTWIRNILRLCNIGTISKIRKILKYGGLSQLLVCIDNKLKRVSILQTITYSNTWLKPIKNKSKIDIVVDIIIPIYSNYDFIKKCVESVFNNTDLKYRLFLINNCHSDAQIKNYLEKLSEKKQEGCLLELQVLHNEKNLDPISYINRKIKSSNNHIVLLKADTEVPSGWLSRLVRPILEGTDIASVTPYSNAGEICSFPSICENNQLSSKMDVNQVDACFCRYGGDSVTNIPSGVSFCMAMNRQCIDLIGGFDTIYTKGYGEEKDWCCRAVKYGYRNVQVHNLFVYQKYGLISNKEMDKIEQEGMEESITELTKRYPNYFKLVQKYINADSHRAQRTFIQAIIESNSDISGILFISHSLGGGTKFYQDEQIRLQLSKKRVYSIEILTNGKTAQIKRYKKLKEETIAYLDFSAMTVEIYRELLLAINIQEIYINHLKGFNLPDFLEWNISVGIPYIVFLHDFYMVCPNFNLLNNKMHYCYAEKDATICNRCLQRSFNVEKVDIRVWRERFRHFLLQAEMVLAPSKNTVDLFRIYYPELEIIVREHSVSSAIYKTYLSEFAQDEIKTVAILGGISHCKGVDIVYRLAEMIEKSSQPIRLVVIGVTSYHKVAWQSTSGKFEITGNYSQECVSEILAKYRVNLVLIPSIWPETYSYTTTEAIASGYPVMVFDLGAPAERVKKLKAGWCVQEISADALWEKIQDVLF